MSTVRSTMLASAFALTVATAVTGAALTGETREVGLGEACARETWPAIPARCLTGNPRQAVRVIPMDGVAAQRMDERFAVAFE